MTPAARGIHAHPTRKLGARTGDLASNTPALHLRDFVRLAVPDHPITDPAPRLNYPMDRNDEAGVCVVAGADHFLQIVHTLLEGSYVNWTDDEILGFYQTQNPGFRSWADAGGPDDQGMDIQTFLSYLVKKGIILGFAKLDTSNEDEVKAALYLFLAIVTGEELQDAQQSGVLWDYVPGSPDWGGHCTVWAGFPGSPDYDDTISWGGIYEMTQTFVRHCVSEAYVIITKAHVARPDFREGFDLAKFGEAFTQLTGRPFPVVVPPGPGPTPPQPPTPGVDLAAAVAEWWEQVEHWAVDERHVADNKHAAQAAQKLARTAGLLI